MNKSRVLIVLVLLIPLPALRAHGTQYEIVSEGVIGVKAMFDTGVLMADARVLIFAPGETKPCLETVTDANGIVCFRPDRPGIWIIQVREQSGHGMRINLTVDAGLVLADQPSAVSGTTYTQKVIMAVCVVWGMLGTALFFKRKGT